MIRIPYHLTSDESAYIPAPCRGIVVGLKNIWQTNAVEPGDTIIASRDTTAVNTVTAVNTAGLVVEVGVRDVTNKDLVFDPASATEVNKVIKLVTNGAAGVSRGVIEFDEYAAITQPALES